MSEQLSSHHFCVVYAADAKSAYVSVEKLLASQSSIGQKALEYEVSNVINVNDSSDVLIYHSQLMTLHDIEKYFWQHLMPIPWDIRVPGDIAVIKLENQKEMLQEDWHALMRYAEHKFQKTVYTKTEKFDISYQSLFSERFDMGGVTHLVDSLSTGNQYVVIVKNFSLF